MRLRLLIAAAALAAPMVLSAAESAVIPPGDYPAAAEREIDAATGTVRLFLYLFSYQSSQPDSGPSRLARALVRARKRGVDVRAVLGRPVGTLDPATAQAKNQAAARFLSAGGVDVFLSTDPAPLHAKALVVDGRTLLVGSSNWSASAFERNHEADVLLRSTEDARALLASFAALPQIPWPRASTETVAVPLLLLELHAGLDAVSRGRGSNALDAYLRLLREGAVPGRPFQVDPASLAARLNWAPASPADTVRHVRRLLALLRDKGRLLTFQDAADGRPLVSLSRAPNDDSFELPVAYFDFGWDRRLSPAAKDFLLISLYYSQESPLSPSWSNAESFLARRHGIGETTLVTGVGELRRAGLLEVRYDAVPPGGGSREPTVYTNNPFYDPAALETRFQVLGKAYGADRLARARTLAALVYEDSDAEGIQALLDLQPRLPPGAEREASEMIAAKSPTNPKRTMAYLLATLRNMLNPAPDPR